MARSKLFEFAVILHPSEKEEEDGVDSKLIVKPETILARDDKVAALKIARAIPAEYEDMLDRAEIVIRPF